MKSVQSPNSGSLTEPTDTVEASDASDEFFQKGSRNDSTGTSKTKTMFRAPLGGETSWLPELQR